MWDCLSLSPYLPYVFLKIRILRYTRRATLTGTPRLLRTRVRLIIHLRYFLRLRMNSLDLPKVKCAFGMGRASLFKYRPPFFRSEYRPSLAIGASLIGGAKPEGACDAATARFS